MGILNNVSLFIVVISVGFLYRRFIDKIEMEQEVSDLYLINNELLKKSTKPIMWITVPRIKNARKWASFYSRTSNNLNIPYMYLTIKSIIAHNANNFQICIIDDDSFGNLLPNWDLDLGRMGDPLREKIRYLGMMKLLHQYGGMFVPPSFLCLTELEKMYTGICDDNKPFVVETVSYSGNERFALEPYFIGCRTKQSPIIKEYVDYLSQLISRDYTAESIFLNDLSKWCLLQCNDNKMVAVCASKVGTKNIKGEAVIVEHFFEQQPIDISPQAYGILIPHEQIVKRTALNWFCYVDKNVLATMDTELGKYFSRIV